MGKNTILEGEFRKDKIEGQVDVKEYSGLGQVNVLESKGIRPMPALQNAFRVPHELLEVDKIKYWFS